jgi:hypothetical protein
MLSAIGLALDAVGAVRLVLLLFLRTRFYTTFGGAYVTPQSEATAAGFGAIGLIFLPTGFVLQSIPYFTDVFDQCSHAAIFTAWIIILGVGSLAAFGIFTLGYVWSMERARRGDEPHALQRRTRGLRRWKYDDPE